MRTPTSIFLVGLFLLFSCKKAEVEVSAAIGASEVSTYTAVMNVVVETSVDVNYEWGIAYGLTTTPKNENSISSNQYGNSLNYQISLTDLMPNTTYYAQPWYSDGNVKYIDEVISFKTDTALVPGEAMITGLVNLVYDISIGASPAASQVLDFNSGQSAQNVSWAYNGSLGPFGTIDPQTYSIEVDLNTGTYVLTIPTEGFGGNVVLVDFGIYDFVGTRIEDNQAQTADSTVSGTYSMSGSFFSTPLFAGDSIYQDFTLDFTPL